MEENKNIRFYDEVERTKETLWGAYIPQTAFYIAPMSIDPDSVLYFVNRGGVVKQTPEDFHIARHDTYPYTQVCCVISGQGSLTMGGRTWKLLPGRAYLLPSYESHYYETDPETPMGLVWLEFAGGRTTEMARAIIDQNGPIFEGTTFETILNYCMEFLNKPNGGNVAQSSLLVYEILLCMYTAGDQEEGSRSRLIDELYDYINSHIHEPIHMADVAKHFGYNASYFSSMFSELFGVTFTKYLLRCRISKARYLLTTTDLPLENISSALGFYDTSHFIQRFREAEDISPARYRKKHTKTENEIRQDPG